MNDQSYSQQVPTTDDSSVSDHMSIDAAQLKQLAGLYEVVQKKLENDAILSEELLTMKREVTRQTKDIGQQKEDAKDTKNLAILGFIVALIALGGIILADVAYLIASFNQTSQQTALLQEIKDKVEK